MKTQNHQNLRLFLLLYFSLLIFFFIGASSVHCSKEGEEKERERFREERRAQLETREGFAVVVFVNVTVAPYDETTNAPVATRARARSRSAL